MGETNDSRRSGSATPAVSMNRGPYVARLNHMARVCKDTWQKIAHFQALSNSTKAYVLLHHVVARFEETFSERASLSTSIDGLSNHKYMRPARIIKGLRCNACHSAPHDAEAAKEPLKFQQLLEHFRTKHCENPGNQSRSESADWHIRMLPAPNLLDVSDLQKGPGKHKPALQIVTEAFPWFGEFMARKAQSADQRRGPVCGDTPKRPSLRKPPAAHGVSRTKSYQHDLDRKTKAVEAAIPEIIGAVALKRDECHLDAVGHGHGEPPALRSAQVVYGTAEDLNRYLPERDASHQGKIYQARSSPHGLRYADGEYHPSAASTPYARLYAGGFEALGTPGSRLGPERAALGAGEPLCQAAQYGVQPRTDPDWMDHVSTREYLPGGRCESYRYTLPASNGGVHGNHFQHDGAWGLPAPPPPRAMHDARGRGSARLGSEALAEGEPG